MVVAHNILAANSGRQLGITTANKKKSSEKLSSGYRINRSADDAAGLAISEKMRWQIRGLERGQQNIQDGISWLQVADGSMKEIAEIIQRIRQLSVQASNDTNTQADRAAIDNEISELKKEINKISCNAEFNTQDIFDNSHVSMDIDGVPNDLQVFDATYDAATGDVTYGGFIFHGERYSWDTVAPGMVAADPATGKQIFTGGEYSYTDSNGNHFQFSCQAGDEVPKITRTIDISADDQGIVIDGYTIDWSDVIDEDGHAFSSSNIHGGAWSVDYMGATIGFFVGDVDSKEAMIDSINSSHDEEISYTWSTKFTGTTKETAVDAQVIKELQISNSFAALLTSGDDVSLTVRAGKGGSQDGIWLEDKDGNTVNGSFKSWADLGISSWDSGADISSDIKYTYADDDGVNDTLLSFDFYLSDITSADSVIDGLDGMVISAANIQTNYSTDVEKELVGNVQKVTAAIKNGITFEDEKALGRDFDQKEIDAFKKEEIEYDEASQTASLTYKGSDGTDVLSYSTSTVESENQMDADLNAYAAYVIQQKQILALAGEDPQAESLGSGSLTDLLGADHITTSGYFSEDVTIKSGMTLSDGGVGKEFQPGTFGETYPAASVDFSGLGTDYTLDDLLGLGFNSTCKTCSRHYSIIFTDSGSQSVSGEGFGYSFRQQGSADFLLQVDISSLRNKGVDTGAELAGALVDITKDCFDFHYTQYASDGSTLYIYDNRPEDNNDSRKQATFDTAPYYSIDTDVFEFPLETADGRSIDVSYTYSYGDFADSIVVEMQPSADGSYVQDADGSYVLYNDNDLTHVGADRYDLTVSYKSADGSGTLNSLEEAVDSYKSFAMADMLNGTSVKLNVKDYTYMDLRGNENSNVAIRAVFDSELVETPYENGLNIQNSSLVGDKITIPRFAMNTVVLRLYRAGAKTYDQAQSTIDYCDYALNTLSGKRSLYGAYQNRLESAYRVGGISEENAQAAESRIRDTDMAKEMVNLAKHNILEQAGQSMLAQANQNYQGISALLS